MKFYSEKDSIFDEAINEEWQKNLVYDESDYKLIAQSTPLGHYLTHILPADAMAQRWIIVSEKSVQSAPSTRVLNRVKALDRQHMIHQKVTKAIQIAYTYGQSLIALIDGDPYSKKKKTFHLEVFPFKPELIKYKDDGSPKEFVVLTYYKGLMKKHLSIPAERVVTFVHNHDPEDRPYEGQSILKPVMLPLIQQIAILNSYAKIIKQRGMGLVDITTTNMGYGDADDSQYKQIMKKYVKKIASDAIIVHDASMEVNAINGISQGFDILDASKALIQQISAGTGIAESRLLGVQKGQVTGSETDQDNYASVLKTIQDEFDEAILQVYSLLDPQLEGKFEIEFEIKLKMDKSKQAQVLSLNASTINALDDILTANQALAMLNLPLLDDPAANDTSVREYFQRDLLGPSDDNRGQVSPDKEPKPPQTPTDSAKKVDIRRLKAQGMGAREIQSKITKKYGSGTSFKDV